VVAAAAAVATLTALVVTGFEYAAYLEAPWVVGIVAYAGVLAGRTTGRVGTGARRPALGAAGAMALVLGAYVAATFSDATHRGAPWWSSVVSLTWSVQALAVLAVVVLGAAVLWSRTRQAVPVLVGVVVALLLSRSSFFWSGNLSTQSVDLGNVLALLAFSLIATVAARWAVNRLDELAEARASHRAQLSAMGGLPGPGAPHPGEPTAV
jgi:hypothetical protein